MFTFLQPEILYFSLSQNFTCLSFKARSTERFYDDTEMMAVVMCDNRMSYAGGGRGGIYLLRSNEVNVL